VPLSHQTSHYFQIMTG